MSFILHPIIQYDYLYNETFLLSLHDALPIYYAGRFFCCNPARIRCGVNGASRRRTPVASKIALAMAAPTGALDGSPPPRAGISGRLIKTISTSGTSANLIIG